MLADDVRECPATWTLAATWVVVFVLMHLVQWNAGIPFPPGGMANPLGISSQVGHRFGDMTWAEVLRGEVWRLVTATFVHFSLIHLGMNAFGLTKLGQLIEPWYGPGPFLAICVAIGGLGNLVGGLIRQIITLGKTALVGTRLARTWPGWFEVTTGAGGVDESFGIPSGGGSTILLGLLGLGAVVGWRSKTRIGSFLRDQMLAMLVFTAVLGIALINLIDNYGHAGGAIVGAAFGFAHRPILRISERSRTFRATCWGAVAVVLVGSVLAAARDDRSESGFRAEFNRTSARFQLDDAALGDLQRVSILFARQIALTIDDRDPGEELDLLALEPLLKAIPTTPLPTTPRPVTPDQWRDRTSVELRNTLVALDSQPATAWGDPAAGSLAEIKTLGRAAATQPPSYRQVYAFVVAWRAASRAILLDRDQAQTQLVQLERRAQ